MSLWNGVRTVSYTHLDVYKRQVLERNSDMVVGDRLSSTYFEENKRPFHNMGNSLVLSLIHIFFLKAINKHKYEYLRKIETNVCTIADKVILNN